VLWLLMTFSRRGSSLHLIPLAFEAAIRIISQVDDWTSFQIHPKSGMSVIKIYNVIPALTELCGRDLSAVYKTEPPLNRVISPTVPPSSINTSTHARCVPWLSVSSFPSLLLLAYTRLSAIVCLLNLLRPSGTRRSSPGSPSGDLVRA
jgi:hypothetical protein